MIERFHSLRIENGHFAVLDYSNRRGFNERQLWLSGEGDGTPLQYSCLENPMDRGAWWAAVHGVAKSPTQLSAFPFTFHFHALEKEMATHSSVLAWRIPGTGEPGGLLPMESHRVGHDWSDLAAAAALWLRDSTFHKKARFRKEIGIKAVLKGPGTGGIITILWQERSSQDTRHPRYCCCQHDTSAYGPSVGFHLPLS